MICFDQPLPPIPSPSEEQLLSCFWEAEQMAATAGQKIREFSIRDLIGLLPPEQQEKAYTTFATLVRRLESKGFIRCIEPPPGYGMTQPKYYCALCTYPEYRERLFSALRARYPEVRHD